MTTEQFRHLSKGDDSAEKASTQPEVEAPSRPAPTTPAPLAFDWRTAEPEIEFDESQPLSREMQTYAAHVEILLDQMNDYALIKGDDVIGVYPSRDIALREALDRFGAEPVLIKRIVAVEPILEVGHVEF